MPDNKAEIWREKNEVYPKDFKLSSIGIGYIVLASFSQKDTFLFEKTFKVKNFFYICRQIFS